MMSLFPTRNRLTRLADYAADRSIAAEPELYPEAYLAFAPRPTRASGPAAARPGDHAAAVAAWGLLGAAVFGEWINTLAHLCGLICYRWWTPYELWLHGGRAAVIPALIGSAALGAYAYRGDPDATRWLTPRLLVLILSSALLAAKLMSAGA